ncbi:MAG: LamG domain-containing protein, partial [Candidatus Diapherotrites archaeon]|nr:LamG domain-containing protein [Candidatus Diapherotrites archaeon]
YYGNPLATATNDFDNTFTKEYGGVEMVGEWNLDEESGTVAFDSSDNLNNGNLLNGPVWTASDGGYWGSEEDIVFSTGSSVFFDGSNDYIKVPNSASFDEITNQLSLEIWIKPATFDNAYETYFSKFLSDTNYFSLRRWRTGLNSGKFFFDVRTASGRTLLTANTAPSNFNKWYYVVATWDGITTKIYVNGILENSAAKNGILLSGGNLDIGSTSNYAEYFRGTLDAPRVYKQALTAEEIQAHYQRRKYALSDPTTVIGNQSQVNSPTITDISLNFDLFEMGDSITAIAIATDPNEDQIIEFDFMVLDGLGNEVLNPTVQGSNSYSFTLENGEPGLWQIKAKASNGVYWSSEFSKEVFVNDSSLATEVLDLSNGSKVNTDLVNEVIELNAGETTGTFTTTAINPVNFSKWGI